MADLYIIATLVAKSGQGAALRALLEPAIPTFLAEDGCHAYTLLQDRKVPERFMTYETWRDEAALKAHLTSPTMAAAMPKLAAVMEGDLKIARLDLVR